MVDLIDMYITDDPRLRRIQIVELIISRCAGILWPMNEMKRKQAVQWAKKFRAAMPDEDFVAGDGDSVTSARSNGSAQKLGTNGLVAVSTDAVLCRRESPQKTGLHPKGDKRGMGEQKLVAAPPQAQQPQQEHIERQRKTSKESGFLPDSPSAIHSKTNGGPSSPIVDPFMRHGVRTTPATTLDGQVVLVSSTGTPLLASSALYPVTECPVQVTQLSGGITNELFHVYDPEDKSTSVVVRVFGKETERVILRESELFYQSLFIKTYIHGSNFLVYDFLHNFETLPYVDMGKEAVSIASALAEFQVIATLAAIQDFDLPLLPDEHNGAGLAHLDGAANRTPSRSDTQQRDSGSKARLSRFSRESNYTIFSLTEWVEQVQLDEVVAKVIETKRDTFVRLRALMKRESKEMIGALEAVMPMLGEGVCHNDLLSANIMRHTVSGQLKIIDFDYTKRDFLLFDVGNHFNEYTGIECDYARYFPSMEQMTMFVAEYRRAMRRHLEATHAKLRSSHTGESGTGGDVAEIFPNERALFWTNSDAEEAAVVEEWTKLARMLTLCSNLSWSVWALLQEAISDVDMDFLDYASSRFQRYLDTKEEFQYKL